MGAFTACVPAPHLTKGGDRKMRKILFGILASVSVAMAAPYINYSIQVVDENNDPITSGLNAYIYTTADVELTTSAMKGDYIGHTTMSNPVYFTTNGVLSFFTNQASVNIVIKDTPTVTRVIKWESVAPTKHRLVFPKTWTEVTIATLTATNIDVTVTESQISDLDKYTQAEIDAKTDAIATDTTTVAGDVTTNTDAIAALGIHSFISVEVVADSTTITTADMGKIYISTKATPASFTLPFSSNTADGAVVMIKNTGGSNIYSVIPSGTDQIDVGGAGTAYDAIDADNDFVVLYNDAGAAGVAGNWYILGKNGGQ